MAPPLSAAQMRALHALASTRKIEGEAAGCIGAHPSTMQALVRRGLATEHHRFCDYYLYRITEAGRAASGDQQP